MRLRNQLAGAVALLAVLLAAPNTQAITIPTATYEVSLTHHEFFPANVEYHNSQIFSAPGDYSFPGLTVVRGAVGTMPAISALAHSSASFQQISQSRAGAIYFFEVTGPTVGVQVPLLVTTFLDYVITFDNFVPSQNEASPGIPGYVYSVGASVNVIAQAGGSAEVSCSKAAHGPPSCTAATLAGSLPVTAQTGTVNEIIVGAAGNVDGTNVFGGVTVDAFADPVIAFAPGFDATGFSIELSPGVGNASNASPVPEPATVVMFAMGLPLLALAARRKGKAEKCGRTRICRTSEWRSGLEIESDSNFPLRWNRDVQHALEGDPRPVFLVFGH